MDAGRAWRRGNDPWVTRRQQDSGDDVSSTTFGTPPEELCGAVAPPRTLGADRRFIVPLTATRTQVTRAPPVWPRRFMAAGYDRTHHSVLDDKDGPEVGSYLSGSLWVFAMQKSSSDDIGQFCRSVIDDAGWTAVLPLFCTHVAIIQGLPDLYSRVNIGAAINNKASTITGIVQIAMLRTLPLEIWLQIIEEAGAAGEYDALEACAKANRGGLLEERAQRCIPDEMTFRTQEDVASINMRQRWKGPKEVRIEGGRQSGERRPIPHLATFASRLAGKWTNVKELTIERAEWRVHDLVLPSLILDLACLGIEHLRLYDITFPTILTFWRLVCGLPNLDTLGLCDVKFMKVEAPALSALRRSSSVNPSSLHLGELDTERPRSPTTCSAVLLAQTMTCFKKPSWERLSRLRFQDVKLPAAAVFGRLLGALPALQHLTIDGPCTFSQQGFDLAESAVHPETTSQICTLELGKDFSLCSDAQSVHHLVDILIQSGAIRRLGFIKACLSPSLHVPTSIDVALNRLVTHAGESLRELTLQVLPLDSIPLFKEAYVYGAPSTVHRLFLYWGFFITSHQYTCSNCSFMSW
ncbi:predicted protein [Postia placenta Mad-698-R]|uniref:Uncharacterized protein n=1 Tax=Postia placenta MAD-698-R-SB12 TaxID=670580 RepID=A0A1X6NB14_9APHY|nr:hypothetical protein POSPLADRAFT_1133551 [Postia placenta MAD-698-R-SB12]EED82047.1 predicted protein [Postia placenta Mad-698-R]OSX65702.1 hypothetical protein POSPLADRAFT_1133551 [Postia placenta MAD-698-R-SB12]